jgi:hypothetical protein
MMQFVTCSKSCLFAQIEGKEKNSNGSWNARH